MDEAKIAGDTRELVREFIIKELYPDEELTTLEVSIITVFTHSDLWWVYLDTTVPDEMLYRVSWRKVGDPDPTITAYKKVDLES